MFQTAAGVTVPFPEKLSEQYELDGNTITGKPQLREAERLCSAFVLRRADELLFLAIHPMRKAMRSGI